MSGTDRLLSDLVGQVLASSMTTHDVERADGRILRVHDSGTGSIPVLWHHGSPQTGALLQPLVDAASARDIRFLSYGRPSYGGSTPNPGRSVGSAAADVEAIMDALEIERFATLGHSGGAMHVLACAALLPSRLLAAAPIAPLAPYSPANEHWFDGMSGGGPGLRAALLGRDAYVAWEASSEFDESSFTALDYEVLASEWSAMGDDVGLATAAGPEGMIDDDLAYVSPWGFEPASIRVPVLLVHGADDRVDPAAHSRWLHEEIPDSELWMREGHGHLSILREVPAALDWLLARS
jgi:pimeloyl-ACP methyl ester carboxylesterase